MANMKRERKLAQSLCDQGELEIVLASLPLQLTKLSREELMLWLDRAKSQRDKWRDLSRTQKRSSQKSAGRRQTLPPARSVEKAELFDRAVARLADQLKQTGLQVQAKRAESRKVPRAIRKLAHRATRSTTKTDLSQAKKQVNQSARAATQAAESAARASTPADQPAKSEAPAKRTAKNSTKQKKPKKPKASAADKVPQMTKARKRLLARQAAIEFEHELDEQSRKPTKKSHLTSPAREGEVKRKNTGAKATAHRDRVARSGTKKIRSHVAAATRRAQARRDGK